jgi:hypothetical protein
MSAAEQVVGFGGRRSQDLVLEGLQGLVDAAGGEKGLGCLGSEGEREQGQRRDKEASRTRD